MIGVFDSGYGGLSVLREFVRKLPEYDFMYLGDNARAPYGSRDFDTVFRYTLQNVQFLIGRGCRLIVLACNTASAKALRNIQQKYLPVYAPQNRVLGVIRPMAEYIAANCGDNVGILGTEGTIVSMSYPIEIAKLNPSVTVTQEACPLWVPFVENGECDTDEVEAVVRRNLNNLLKKNPKIDSIVLGCTHYPLLADTILRGLPEGIRILSQGPIVAESLSDYLVRHPEIEKDCSKDGRRIFYTTGDNSEFDLHAELFFGEKTNSIKINTDNGYYQISQGVHP